MSLNRDFFVALFFLILSGVMFVATFQLPPPMFGQMSPALWPRIILVAAGAACFRVADIVAARRSRGGTAAQPR